MLPEQDVSVRVAHKAFNQSLYQCNWPRIMLLEVLHYSGEEAIVFIKIQDLRSVELLRLDKLSDLNSLLLDISINTQFFNAFFETQKFFKQILVRTFDFRSFSPLTPAGLAVLKQFWVFHLQLHISNETYVIWLYKPGLFKGFQCFKIEV